MHPRATAPSDRHTARAGVFSRRRLLAGPRMHTEAEELFLVAVRAIGREENRRGKSSQVKSLWSTRTKLHVNEKLK